MTNPSTDAEGRDEVRLSRAQLAALREFANGPWEAAWWGGKPHGSWPKWLNWRTLDKLIVLRLVSQVKADRPLSRAFAITQAGRAALSLANAQSGLGE